MFGYDPATGHLTSITDALKITSSFTHTPNTDVIQELDTPYGQTTFTYGDSTTDGIPTDPTRWVQAVEKTQGDPTYGRTSRVEFRQGASTCTGPNGWTDITSAPGYTIPCWEGAPSTSAFQPYPWLLQFRNTFVWTPQQYAPPNPSYGYNTPNRYQSAKIIHWLHTNDDSSASASSRIMESVKEPLESRVYYGYMDQSANAFAAQYGTSEDSIGVGLSNLPSDIARLLPDGTVQLWQYAYNSMGHVVLSMDPVGRQLTFGYASNDIDLLTVTNTTRAEAREAIFHFIEVFYNGQRRHSTLGYVSPMEFEMKFIEENKNREYETEKAA